MINYFKIVLERPLGTREIHDGEPMHVAAIFSGSTLLHRWSNHVLPVNNNN